MATAPGKPAQIGETPIISVKQSPFPFIPTLASPEIATSEYVINGQAYEIELYIDNGSKRYIIAPTAIVSLSISDTLADWVSRGSLVVYYANELAEYLNNFVFRNDGYDLLRLRIVPRDLPLQGLPSLNIEGNKKIWELNHLFSIYNIDDVSPQTGGNSQSLSLKKFKKFDFWDIRYQAMLTQNLEYSTGLSTSNKKLIPPTENDALRDEFRSVPTDVAMYEIIKQSLFNDKLLSTTALDLGISEDWDTGQTYLFYTSGSQYNAFEDLMDVYSRHVSSTKSTIFAKDYSILSIERGENNIGYFSLKPLSKYFEKAGIEGPGEYQIEHFFLQNDVRSDSSPGLYRSPIGLNSQNGRDISLRDFSTIVKYEFVDIAPAVNSSVFATTPVYSFDFKNRQFNNEFQNHSIELAEQFFNDGYISKLYKKGGENNFLLRNQSPAKKQGVNYTINPTFSLYGDKDIPDLRTPDGLHRLLYTGLFQNTCINFTVPGLTIREPGRFIAIDRPEGSVDSSFDDKLCGQWFVIDVVHTFANGAYYNNITAVKIHTFRAVPLFSLRDASPGSQTSISTPSIDLSKPISFGSNPTTTQ